MLIEVIFNWMTVVEDGMTKNCIKSDLDLM